jgi:hypothetical protein
VGRHDDGGARFAGKAREERRNRQRVRFVEPRGGLVGQEELRPRGHGARDGDPLALAGGEPGGALLRPLGEPDPTQRVEGTLMRLVGSHSAQCEPELDVFPGAQEGRQTRILADDRDVIAAQRRSRLAIEIGHAPAENGNVPSVCLGDPREQMEQGGLAGPGRPRDGNQPARGEGRGQPREDDSLLGAVPIRFLQAPHLGDHLAGGFGRWSRG